jgi:RNA polymerase sigma-70 factor (ECF subfamily)
MDTMNTEDSQLAARVGNGDREAAAVLVENHYRPVYAFLRRLAGNDADAADLTQKTFVRVWTSLAGFAGRSTLRCWLHGIAYHVYVDWLRGNHHDASPSEEWWEQQSDHRAGPDQQASFSDLAAVLYRAVDSLEADLRIPVHLHYYQGLTLDETAAALGIAASTVKYRLRQALDLLQRQLREKPSSRANLNSLP